VIDTYERPVRPGGRRLCRTGVAVEACDSTAATSARSLAVRANLDSGGCPSVQIIASGNLDELQIEQFVAAGCPSTRSARHATRRLCGRTLPRLCLQAAGICGATRRKRSAGQGQVAGTQAGVPRLRLGWMPLLHTIALADEMLPGRPMLQPVMPPGNGCSSSLEDSRAYARREIDTLRRHCVRWRIAGSPGLRFPQVCRCWPSAVDHEFP